MGVFLGWFIDFVFNVVLFFLVEFIFFILGKMGLSGWVFFEIRGEVWLVYIVVVVIWLEIWCWRGFDINFEDICCDEMFFLRIVFVVILNFMSVFEFGKSWRCIIVLVYGILSSIFLLN